MSEVVKQLSEDLSTLIRQELRLAQAEMSEKGRRAGPGIGLFGGAGLLAMLAFGALTACLVAALATATEVWLAALIVAVVYAAVAALLALAGKERMGATAPLVPEETIETVKEDVRWVKTQLSSGSR
jgi:MFS family permease